MEQWKWVTLLLCGFGLLKELRPSGAFITEYLMEFKNLSSSTIIHELYPISTYTVLATVVIVFLITDFLRYRPIVILEAFSLVLCWIFLIWGQSYNVLAIVQIFYGLAASADVAYYTYIYSQVSKEQYKKVTAYTYGSALLGKFLAGTLGQLLISFKLMNFHELNYISLAAVSLALCLAFFLPETKKSMYFNRQIISFDKTREIAEKSHKEKSLNNSVSKVSSELERLEESSSLLERIRSAYPILWKDFKLAYSGQHVLKWSFWWAIATAGNLQITNYAAALWESIALYTETDIYNGAVATVQCLLSALASFAVGHVKVNWKLWGEPFLCIISLLQGFAIIWMSQTSRLKLAYLCYIVFRVLFQLVITIASSEIANGINEDSCGLIFGINTFVALIFQSLLTIIVVDKKGLALDERNQFFVYGSYFVILGVIFFVAGIWMILTKCFDNNSESVDTFDIASNKRFDYEKNIEIEPKSKKIECL